MSVFLLRLWFSLACRTPRQPAETLVLLGVLAVGSFRCELCQRVMDHEEMVKNLRIRDGARGRGVVSLAVVNCQVDIWRHAFAPYLAVLGQANCRRVVEGLAGGVQEPEPDAFTG